MPEVMNNKSKLKQLLPILEEILSEEDLKLIGIKLQQKRCFTSDITKKSKKSEGKSTAACLVDELQGTAERNWAKYFQEAIQHLGNSTLLEIIQGLFGSKKPASLLWMFKQWEVLKISKNIFAGVEFIVDEIYGEENNDVSRLLAVVHMVAISKQDSKTIEILISQMQRNLLLSPEPQADVKKGHSSKCKDLECLGEMLSSILTPDQCVKIAESLKSSKHISADDCQRVTKCFAHPRTTFDTYMKLLQVCTKASTLECNRYLLQAIKTQGGDLLAKVVEVFINGHNSSVMWLLSHWKDLNSRASFVKKYANQSITTKEEISKSDDLWLCHIIHAVTKAQHEKITLFMREMYRHFDYVPLETEINDENGIHHPSAPILSPQSSSYQQPKHSKKQPKKVENTGDKSDHVNNNKNSVRGDQKTLEIRAGSSTKKDTANINGSIVSQMPSVNETENNGKKTNGTEYRESTTSDVICVKYDDSNEGTSKSPSNINSSAVGKTSTSTGQKNHPKEQQSQSQNGDSNQKKSYLEAAKAAQITSKSTTPTSNQQTGINHQNFTGTKTNNYNLRSGNVKQNESQNKLTLFENSSNYTNESGEGVSVEFRLRIDVDCKSKKQMLCFVYIRNPKFSVHFFQLYGISQYEGCGMYWCTCIAIPKQETEIVYKYLLIDECGTRYWEHLPNSDYGIINRKTTLVEGNSISGNRILFDVANFDRSGNDALHVFRTMYSRNIKFHLPQIRNLRFGDCNPGQVDFKTFVNLLHEWWRGAVAGVKFDDSWELPADISASCRAEFQIFLISNSKPNDKLSSRDAAQRALAFLAFSIVLKTFEKPTAYGQSGMEVWKRSMDLWQGVCCALSLLKVEAGHTQLLFKEISDSGLKAEMVSILNFLLERNKGLLRSLWLIPIYYLLHNDGNCSINLDVWNDILKRFDLEELRRDAKSIKEITSTIIQDYTSNAFPKMLEIYVDILPCNLVLHCVNTENALLQSFQPVHFLQRIASDLLKDDLTKFTESEQFMAWVGKYVDSLETECQTHEKHEELLDLVCSLGKATKTIFTKLKCSSKQKYKYLVKWLPIALQVQTCSIHLSKTCLERKIDYEGDISLILDAVIYHIQEDRSTDVSFFDVEFWNCVLTVCFPDEEEIERWQSVTSALIQDLLLKKLAVNSTEILEVFGSSLDTWKACKEVEACFSEAIYKHALHVSKDKSRFGLNWFFGSSFKKNMVPIFERVFLKEWDGLSRRDYYDGALQFLLHWPFAVNFYKLFEGKEHMKMLNGEIQKRLQLIKQQLRLVIDDVKSAKISHQNMTDICEAKKTFIDVLSILDSDKETGTAVDFVALMHSLVDTRTLELKAFAEMKEHFLYFTDIFQAYGNQLFNLSRLNEALAKNISVMSCCDIVRTGDRLEDESPDINVIFFQFDDVVKVAIKEIFDYKIKDTELILKVWFNEVETAIHEDDEQEELLVLEKIVPIWDSVKHKLSSLKRDLDKETITLDRVSEVFGSCEKERTVTKDGISRLLKAIYAFPNLELQSIMHEINDNDEEDSCGEEQLENEETFSQIEEESAEDEQNVVEENFDEDNIAEVEHKVEVAFAICDAKSENVSELLLLHDCSEPVALKEESIHLPSSSAAPYQPKRIQHESLTELNLTVENGCDDKSITVDDQELCSSDESSTDLSNLPSLPDDQQPKKTLAEQPPETPEGATSTAEEQNLQTAAERISYRVDQIHNYFALKQHQVTASGFSDLKECLQLEGDFSYIDIVQKNDNISQGRPLKSITSSLIRASKSIQGITPEQINLLEEFVKNKELIEWLRDNMEDRKEVKVMSDLAMISAGEATLELDRVSCFLSAVMGFAPFIFDLQTKADLNEALDALQKVWETYKRDKKLLEKWHGTAQYLDWLKGIKDFHGSVEKSSLSRAQDINANGIYLIGGETEAIPTVENSLKLEIETAEDTDVKVMTRDELRNLQSRLMLIAGEAEKGLDEVKVFIGVLAHVENLTKAYVELKLAGCLLFNNWTVELRYRPSSEDEGSNQSLIKILFDKESQPVLCKENVTEELKRLTTVLKDAHQKWKNSMSEKRKQFYHLNHFNIHQISYLCKDLATLKHFSDISDQLFVLLASVKHDVSRNDIINLLEEAIKVKDELNPEEEYEEIPIESIPSTPIDQKKHMTRKLVNDDDIPENLAKASVQAIGIPLDYDECYLKSLEIQYDEEQIMELVKEFDQEVGFEADASEINVIQSVINDRSNLTLQRIIEKILESQAVGGSSASVVVKTACERYLEETAMTSLSDCISIEHLGQFLTSLSMRANAIDIYNRLLPKPLEQGKPNLIICPEQDMFSAILSIYMHSPEEPLPTLSEVLLCSESTSKEETELLLRRAMQQTTREGSKIYCIAFADKLSFDVSNATENAMKQLEKESNLNLNYKLVVICSSSQHFIASLLYENQVEFTLGVTPEATQEYLAKHLRIDNSQEVATSLEENTVKTSVQVVLSNRAGLGKSLHVKNCRSRLPRDCRTKTIRLLDKKLDEDDIMQSFCNKNEETENRASHFIHFDVTPSVQEGVNQFMFKLLILGAFEDRIGRMWRRQPSHLYLIEYTNSTGVKANSLEQRLLNLLPAVHCISPREVVQESGHTPMRTVLLMDNNAFLSETYQRPYQFLSRYSKNQNLDEFCYETPTGTHTDCLSTLLRYCSIQDPSWSELRHFASFLNCQLLDCEKSIFCKLSVVGHDSGLSGFKSFVVRFMIRMSQDFATPSLSTSESFTNGDKIPSDAVFELHQLRRHWEESIHPYLFFNEDHISMTFVNFKLNGSGDLLHPKTMNVMERGLVGKQLVQGLQQQRVNLNDDFDSLHRQGKLMTLCRIMGIQENMGDPDPTYELTTDNVLKMLAIHMRFRCDIPVVVMGETGCGKTRMIEFMSKLKAGGNNHVQNMVIVKVHGGITVPIIQDKVKKAILLARENKQQHGIETILFLDEANTTEAIYAIKEFVCDGTVHGEAFEDTGLHIVAACNPYRMHSKEALKNMEESGLGFRVKTEDTSDKLGNLPMRCLVYRVIALPPSMQPLVWDFGQLTNEAERVYIEQMVSKLGLRTSNSAETILFYPQFIRLIVDVLATSQRYMREQRQQCSFVSLRDVERCLQSFRWFFQNSEWLFELIEKERAKLFPNSQYKIEPVIQALLQSVGMCYHVTLETRDGYRKEISTCFSNAGFPLMENNILVELIACQSVFIENINLEDNIARNEALRENVFMMVMCTEMRIPLFLIGKPGSSKSLAKTIVTDAMQGPSSRSEIFRRLKQIHILSFQCSAVSDAIGIEAVFTQCSLVQKNQDAEKFVSVVVLDEVGLAEDSPKMPLKVLHPLLEGGGINLHDTAELKQLEGEDKERVGFVGISNWALDPAKMNRGIFVYRGVPTTNDLKLTAQGIFSSDSSKFKEVDEVVDVLTDSYVEICEKQKQQFFGLRDYYGLLKMIFAIVTTNETDLEFFHVATAIKRNFSGGKQDCFEIFLTHLKGVWPDQDFPRFSLENMIKSNLESVHDCESRFLLLLSNRFAAVNLLQKVVDCSEFEVIFGSSFPQDNDYTELCRNINRIKICMESGCTVVLLNLRDLYESLYDALNQHYVTFAGQRYVDLGLGGHRVKCRVAKEFRLIVIEDKNVVYDEFPIPLINRLEKYVFTTDSILSSDHEMTAKRLKAWVKSFTEIPIPLYKRNIMKPFEEQDSFVGYTNDTAPSALLSMIDSAKQKDLYVEAQMRLLNTATMDSVFRLPKSKIVKEARKLQEKYMLEQTHDNLYSFFKKILQNQPKSPPKSQPLMYEITSFSQILSEQGRQKLEVTLGMSKNSVMLLTLQQFSTQDAYIAKVEMFFDNAIESSKDDGDIKTFILFIQCPQADIHGNLIACARYSVKNMIQRKFGSGTAEMNCYMHTAFLFTIERQCSAHSNNSLFSFFSADCESVHIDELRMSADYVGHPSKFWNKTMSEVLEQSRSCLQMPPSDCKLNDPDYLLDSKALVCNCIPNAVIRLRNSSDRAGYEVRDRMKILHYLCIEAKMVSVLFLEVLFKKIVSTMKDRDHMLGAAEPWYLSEACSHESLHEGGTFSKTLWLCLKSTVTSVIAKIISVVDADNNLDIICQNVDPQMFDLWLRIFADKDICHFKWKDISNTSKEFEVAGWNDFSCHFPFSRKITDFFSSQWLTLPGGDHTENILSFFNRIKTCNINHIIVDSLETKPMRLVEFYIHDLICLKQKPEEGNDLESELVAKSLLSLFKLRQQKQSFPGDNFLAAVYSIYMECIPFLQQLSLLISLLPSILTEKNVKVWLSEQSKCCQFVLHKRAYLFILEHLKSDIQHLSQPECYRSWRDLVKKVLNTEVDGLENSEIDESDKIGKDITKMTTSIAFVELFLNMMIPDGLPDDLFQQYLKILAHSAKLLSKGAEIAGLSSDRFLKIVMDQLRGCTKDMVMKHTVSWKDLKCKLCGKSKAVQPVVLPCEHFFCLNCIRLTTNVDIRKCPTCHAVFPDNFPVSPTQLTPETSREMDGFKANCNSFFLEYLSNLCFPAPCSGSSDATVIENVSETLQHLVICEKELTTRAMTPLDMETFDKTPTVRSFILQLLLRYDPVKTETVLENHFQEMGKVLKKKHDLMMIYIRCIEDSLQNRASAFDKKNESVSQTGFAKQLLEEIGDHLEFEESSQIESLNVVAKLRYLMKFAAKHCFDLSKDNEMDLREDKREFLNDLRELFELEKLSVAKQYFVKILCRRYGVSVFSHLLKQDELLFLVPQELITEDRVSEASLACSLYALGEVFSDSQKVLLSVETEDAIEIAVKRLIEKLEDSQDTTVQVLQAVVSWLNSSQDDESKNLRKKLFTKLIESLQKSSVVNHYGNLIQPEVFVSTVPGMSSHVMNMLREIVEVTGATIHACSDSILREIADLITNPNNISSMFLPTMPQSFYFDITNIANIIKGTSNLDAKSYKCPNGHVFFIGECTAPNERGICPDCKEPIGGAREGVALPGTVAGSLSESSQAGYLLGNPEKRGTSVIPERNLSRLSMCVMRIFLHSALLNASINYKDIIIRVLKLSNAVEVQEFLFRHLEKDLNQFCECLGKSVDDALLLIHQIMKEMRTKMVRTHSNASIASMAGRKYWESEFHHCFLASIFTQTDEKIEEAREICMHSQRQTTLDCLVYEIGMTEDSSLDDNEKNVVPWTTPFLWRHHVHVTVEHLRQRLEGIVFEDGVDGMVLKRILNETNMFVVNHLQAILVLQTALVQRFQRKVDMADVDKMTIRDYCVEEDRSGDEETFQQYIDIWNLVKENLPHPNSYATPKEYLDEEMDFDSPISMCIPSEAGRGSCALALTEYIVEKQNNLLMKCRELIKPSPTFKEISATSLKTADLICIDNDRNLMPLILANSQYEITVGETGSEPTIVYRIPTLEKQIMDKFILNKKMINKKTLPRIVYLQDMGIEAECRKVRDNIEQSNLPPKIVQKMDERMRKARLPDVCEGVRTLTLVISYLAKVGSSPDYLLRNYVTDDLRLPAEEASMIPQSAQLRHALAVFERLSWQRSVRFVAIEQDPYANIKHAEQEEIQDVESVKKCMDRVDISQLQLELNSFVLMKQSLLPESNLKANLEAHLEEKANTNALQDDDGAAEPAWCSRLPAALKIKHAAHLFKISVEMDR